MAQIKWLGGLITKEIDKAIMSGTYLGAEAVLKESKEEVPHESGTLERSGAVTEVRSESAVYVSYNTPYARRQHEDLTLNHEEGRKAKYLEDPYNRNIDKIQKLINLKIQEALRG